MCWTSSMSCSKIYLCCSDSETSQSLKYGTPRGQCIVCLIPFPPSYRFTWFVVLKSIPVSPVLFHVSWMIFVFVTHVFHVGPFRVFFFSPLLLLFLFSLLLLLFGFLFLPFLCVWSEFAINTVPRSQRALRLFDWVRFPWGNCNFHERACSAGAQYYSITTAGNMKNTLVNRCLGSLKIMQIGENNWNSFLIWFFLLSLQVADMVLCFKHN